MSNAIALQPRGVTIPSLFGAEPRFAATGIFLALSLLATMPAMMLDTRVFLGENVWIKPIKFQIALLVYMLTLAFFARFLPAGMTSKPLYKAYSAVVVFAVAAETVWIAGAAMFGIASHFNDTQPFMTAIYPLMGLLAVTLTSASLVYGAAMLWEERGRITDPLRLSIALGLVLTFVLTVPVAGTLSSLGGHHIGTPVTGAAMPFFGWSGEVGDLRVSHFLATHALHFVPLAGLAIGAITAGMRASLLVWVAAALFSLIVGATYFQAMAGLPLIELT